MYRNRFRRGSILAEYIISILIVITFIPLLILCIRINLSSLTFQEEAQDEIALAQLKKILNVGSSFEVSSNMIQFDYHDEKYRLYLVNDHLILTPGTQIFLSDIDSINFYLDQSYIYCTYKRKEYSQTRVLTHV